MKTLRTSALRFFQPSAFRLSGFSLQPSAFRPSVLQAFPSRLSGFLPLLLAAFSLQAFSPSAFSQTPLFPDIVGTYYYEGYDAGNDRYVYIHTTGTYYYVDSGGVTTIGGQASLPISNPYRATIAAGGTTNFQFYNALGALYTVTTSTDAGGIVTTATTYAARSGTWFARDITLATTTVTDLATIQLLGYSNDEAHPVVFDGENLAIIADGANAATITMGNGHNILTLKDSTITSITTRGNTSQAIYLNDTLNLGGNHFYGENLTITNSSGRVFAFGAGDNTVTLVSSTLVNNGVGAAFGWNSITSTTRRSFEKGSFVTLEDTTVITTANYSPIFQMIGDWGGATVTGGTLSTDGVGSTILRLVSQNNANARARFLAIFDNTVLDARQGSVIDINIDAANSPNNYGQAGGAAKTLAAMLDDAYDILIQSSTITGGIAAMRLAAAGGHAAPYGNKTYVLINDSVFAGGIQMIAGGGVNETSGAYLTLSASNSQFSGGISITGADAARISNRAIFHVYDSTFEGDIALTNHGNLVLHFTNTPIEGDLSLDGATDVDLRLTNSPITGAITVAGNALLAGEILGTGQIGSITAHGGVTDLTLDRIPAGAITADGTALVSLRIGGGDAISAGIHLSGNATLDIALRNATRFAGDATILDRATLTLSTASGAPLAFDGNVSLAGIWRVTGNTTLTGNLAINDPLGTIAIADARPDSLVLANGLSGHGRLDILSIDSNTLADPEIRVIHDQTGAFVSATSAPLILAHPVDYGLAAYTLENRADGAYLVGGLDTGSFGAGGAAVFNSQALVVEDWFAALAPINQHLELLRSETENRKLKTGNSNGDSGTVWLQTRVDITRVNRSGQSLDFTTRTLGITAGADTRRDLGNATLTIGAFANSSRAIRDFTGSAGGRATGAGGGAYAHYQNRKGLHLSAIARFDIYETDLDTHNPNNAMSANYHTQAGGIALEAGWRFDRADGWWFAPAGQVAIASLPGVSYTTQSTRQGNIVPITIGSTRATQLLGRLSFGRNLNQNWSFRGHAIAAYTNASGGDFSAPNLDRANFTISGLRAEGSAGLARLVGRSGRLTIDATLALAADYNRPCGIMLGYCHNW